MKVLPLKISDKINVDAACRRLVHRALQGLEGVDLRIEDKWGATGVGPGKAAPIHIEIKRPGAYRRFIVFGTLGAAEAFIDGDWECSDLVAFFQAMIRNTKARKTLDRYRPSVVRWSRLLAHRLRANTKGGSKQNIKDHYDLGNEFFSLFLDPTLCYSCGYFESEDATLHQASLAKLDLILGKLQLKGSDHLLEIGCGWGALSLRAAEVSGCRVTAVTLSREQYELTRKRVQEAGLSEQIKVVHQDYREITGSFTKIVSIEMIEAVGHAFYDTFFNKCSSLLPDDGVLLLQAITRPDRTLKAARKEVEFTQAQIFPGSELATVTALCESAARSTDLMVTDLHDITPHYSETLKHWRLAFVANLDRVRAQGFSETFIRQWLYYFAICEASFRERHIGDIQILFTKPGWRGTVGQR